MFKRKGGSYNAQTGVAYIQPAKRAKPSFVQVAGPPVAVAQVKAGKSIIPLAKGKERVGGYYGRYNLPGGGSENKFFDTSLSFNFDATAEVPATGQLTLIPQGVTESTRVGRKCTIKSIQIRGAAIFGGTNDSEDIAYLYVVLDKQCNGAAAAITDVLTSNNMRTGLINMANSERFVILKRFVLPLKSGAGVATAFGNCSAPIEWFHRCNIPIEYSSTTGAITEIRSNNIFLLAGGIRDDVTSFLGTCRLRFSDD